MVTLSIWLPIIHFVGMALAVGAATAKVWLVLKCRSDHAFVPMFFRVSKILTRQIIAGMILMTISGIIWLITGYDFSSRLIVKLALFAAVWVLGPVIDNVVEPRYRNAAMAGEGTPNVQLESAHRRFLVVEIAATLLFYAIIVIWMLR